MISSAAKVRLLVFVVLTLVGVAYVGARYAQVDRLLVDETYHVTADFAESGGIFVGADVSYRGVSVGRVSDLELSESGVDVTLEIDEDTEDIPGDLTAVVANKSAVGEQYIDLQPQSDSEPYLADGSTIDQANTRTPLSTQQLLTDMSQFAGSVNTKDLRTVVHELGVGFDGTGRDLSRIIDTSNSFIETANKNFGVTAALIRDGQTALEGQLASQSSIRAFSRDLAAFSDTLRASDGDIRTVLDDAPATARQIGALLEENEQRIEKLIGNLQTVNRVVTTRLPGVRGLFVLAPYAVENGFSVLSKNPRTGKYEIRFGLALSRDPGYCREGYPDTTKARNPTDTSNKKMLDAVCKEPASKTNARGQQNATSPPGPVVGTYDPATEEFSAGVPGGLGRTAPETGRESSVGSWSRLMAPGS